MSNQWMIGYTGQYELEGTPCVNCGKPTSLTRPYRDVTPTDRGDEVREGNEPFCLDCIENDAEI